MTSGVAIPKRIRVLHVIPSIATEEGGPSVAIRGIARALQAAGVEITIATTADGGRGKQIGTLLGTRVDAECAKLFSFRRDLLPYKVSIGLGCWLFENARSFDVLHLHALFSFSSTIAAYAARRANVPYVVRPLGVLNRWGLKNRRRFPKRLSLRTIELRLIRHAAAMHYTSTAERAEACEVDPCVGRTYSAVIPLPIETEPKGEASLFGRTYTQARDRRIVLFLSRLNEKKAIELLLEAFVEVHRKLPDTLLAIAGTGEPGYVKSLQRLSRKLGNLESVLWTGHLDCDLKAAAFAAAEVFVLPSSSENFGVAAAEALAQGVPAVLSEAVALSHEARAFDAAVVVEQTAEEISAGILGVLSDRERAEKLAANGRRLVTELYSPATVGGSLRRLYESILERQSRADAFESTAA